MDYFIMYENIPDGVDNAAGIGLAGAAIGMLFLMVNIIFFMYIFTKASKKEIKIILFRGKYNIDSVFFKFYSLSIVCIAIYSIWINNILKNKSI